MSTLTKKQKEAVSLISIGTFLEYFDLMLYIHMAGLLAEIFFPVSNFYAYQLNVNFSLCATYLLRPVGAIFFGYIGDVFGRKYTLILSTLIMSLVCCIMAVLPTYNQIGFTASVIMILCRSVQGMCAAGEVIGGTIYLTEALNPPASFFATGIQRLCSSIGTFAALGIAIISTTLNNDLGWRAAFMFGTVVAIIGLRARSALKESKAFVHAKQTVTNKKVKPASGQNMLRKSIAIFCLHTAWPPCFFLAYSYCSGILKQDFGYDATQIMQHNLYISLVGLVSIGARAYLSLHINPIKILMFNSAIFMPFCIFIPYLLFNATAVYIIVIIQIMCACFGPVVDPAEPMILKSISIFIRVRLYSLTYHIARAIMYFIPTIGWAYMSKYVSHWVILPTISITMLGYIWALLFFNKNAYYK